MDMKWKDRIDPKTAISPGTGFDRQAGQQEWDAEINGKSIAEKVHCILGVPGPVLLKATEAGPVIFNRSQAHLMDPAGIEFAQQRSFSVKKDGAKLPGENLDASEMRKRAAYALDGWQGSTDGLDVEKDIFQLLPQSIAAVSVDCYFQHGSIVYWQRIRPQSDSTLLRLKFQVSRTEEATIRE
jgi:hypothetical protein